MTKAGLQPGYRLASLKAGLPVMKDTEFLPAISLRREPAAEQPYTPRAVILLKQEGSIYLAN
jgi:hypothetical protein